MRYNRDIVFSEPPTTSQTATPSGPPTLGSLPNARSSRSSVSRNASTVLTDDLGKLIIEMHDRFESAKAFDVFIRGIRHKPDLHPEVGLLDHPAAPLLESYYREGVPMAISAPEWSEERKLQVLQRGPHKSARDHREFVREEFAEYVRKGFWVVLPASDVLHLPTLRLSPMGVVPQHERRPRIICDYTFYGVNQDSDALAPEESMQFGGTLPRLLHAIAQADPRYGPIYMGKYDLADGYYRMHLHLESILPLALLFPTADDETPLVALPLVLPMGWSESPPYFCAATETIADLANDILSKGSALQPHRLEEVVYSAPPDPAPLAKTAGPLHPRQFYEQPLRHVDVYIDDLIGLSQGDPLPMVRAILHATDKVFRPLDPTDRPERQEPMSLKKLRKGDGFPHTSKVVLGWLIDTRAYTIHLSPRRQLRLQEILDGLPRSRRRVAVKEWQKVLGELRSMALALPGGRGLFSALQVVFKAHQTRVRLTKLVHDFLDDFRWIAASLQTRPTRIFEIVPTAPTIIGATDAAGYGMGGVFFVPHPDSRDDLPLYESFVWRCPFPTEVSDALVSTTRPEGTISNSDLELAATIAHHDVIAHEFDVRETTIATLHDNTPTVYWNRKGSASTEGPAAYLLRLQALHGRQYRYCPLHDFIPGHLNRMADTASRHFWKSDPDLLQFFDSTFPQTAPWRLCTLRSAASSLVISALHKQRLAPESWTSEPAVPTPTGHCGWNSVPSVPWTPGSPTDRTRYHTSKFSPHATVMDASHPAASPYDLAQFRTPSETWARRSKAWGPATSG